jgi:hypothetical protein
VKPLPISEKPVVTLASLLLTPDKQPEEQKQIVLLVDLLEKMTVLDPNKRIGPEEALRHPFVNPFNAMKKI